jgi:hypothetical protein
MAVPSILMVGVVGRGILRHQLLDDLPRKGWIDTALDLDVGKVSNFDFDILV